jgi:hypothetical protein
MHQPLTSIVLWAPIAAQIVLIGAASLRPRLVAMAAMACSGLTVATMLVALVMADLASVLAAFAATMVFVVGIWPLVLAFQRSPLPPEEKAADELAADVARFLHQHRLPLTAKRVRHAARAVDRATVIRLDTWRDRSDGHKQSGRL